MEHFANKLCEVIRRSSLAPVIKKLKQISVLKGLKGMKKIKRSANFDSITPCETNRSDKPLEGYDTKKSNSSNLASQYSTIKPLENMYTSVKIINGEKHNLHLEKDRKNKLKLQTSEEQVDNERFLEKWMTSSVKEIIMVENYPQSDLAYKSIDSYGAEALKVIDENTFENLRTLILRKKHIWDKLADIMVYRKDSLNNSVTYLLPQFEEKALHMFDMLLRC
jgi:hypothetical protein